MPMPYFLKGPKKKTLYKDDPNFGKSPFGKSTPPPSIEVFDYSYKQVGDFLQVCATMLGNERSSPPILNERFQLHSKSCKPPQS
jgi:hypothetical protein